MTRFGALARKVDERQAGIALPLLSVSQTRGVLRQSDLSDRPPRADSLDAYKICRRGDIVFNKMSIRAGAMGVAAEDGLVTYHYEVMRPLSGSDARFISYLMKSSAFTVELIKSERGIGAGSDASGVRTTEVPFSVMKKIDVWVPPLGEQRQIAGYLDQETGKIDELITKQEQLVATLTERVTALWGNQIDLLKAHHATVSIRRVVSSIVDGPFGSSLTSAHYSDEGARVIRLGNIGIFTFKDADEVYIPLEYANELSAHAVLAGDVVVAGLGDDKMPLGRAAVVPDTLGIALVKADCYRVRPNRKVTAEYLAWALSSPQLREQFKVLSRGSTRQRLNTSVVREATIPLPPRDEQHLVVEQFARASEQIGQVVLKATKVVGTLRERRAALISAAVTGKIDVRGL